MENDKLNKFPQNTLFYGAGNNMKTILKAYYAVGQHFDFPIWDKNAEQIKFVGGQKVLPPDFENKVSDRSAIITIADKAIAEKVAENLKSVGFNIIEGAFDDLPGYITDYENELNYPVECNADEIEIVKKLVAEELTMVTREGLFATVKSCKYVVENNIEGDFVECGVWRGGNAILAAEIFRLHGSKRKVWLFDTFGGFEGIELSEHDGHNYEYHRRLDKNKVEENNQRLYTKDSIEDVKHYFDVRGLLDENVVFVKGNVCETLDVATLPEKIAVLRLDTNLYESTKKEMETLYPLLEKHGALLIDDYGLYAGQKKAIDDYFINNPKPLLTSINWMSRVGIKI